MGTLTDLTKVRFGNLVVLERTRRGSKVVYWVCLCDCGEVKEISANSLRDGRVFTCGSTSCPHHRDRIGSAHFAPAGQSGFRMAVWHYKNRAKQKEMPFSLSDDQCRAIFEAECTYCGAPPQNNYAKNERGSFLYSGIDRIDSNGGYEIGNVQPCCWVCNRMKHVLTHDEFLSHIRKILDRHR